jgi:hypothetical protein
MIIWHKILGVTLVDYFTDTPYSVEIEKELKIPQYLDYIILENTQPEKYQLVDPPDGLENLCNHNLITYKSVHESMNGWAINELISYYVLYRKILRVKDGGDDKQKKNQLKPSSQFKLIAVATRYPVSLLTKERYIKLKEGVYQIERGDQTVDIIVISQLPKTKNNAFWHLFGNEQQYVEFGFENYKWKRNDLKHSVYSKLLQLMEVNKMSYTVKDFQLEVLFDCFTKEEILGRYKPEDRLKGLGPGDLLKGLGPGDLLKGLRVKDQQAGLKPEDFTPDDIAFFENLIKQARQKKD